MVAGVFHAHAEPAMPMTHDITFRRVDEPVTQPVTKFGGQPVWIDGPAWPLSRSLNRPMRFICQIALDGLGLKTPAKMAYLFMTEEYPTYPPGDHSDFVGELARSAYETCFPLSGENAVILQPGPPMTASPVVETVDAVVGPTLRQFEHDGNGVWTSDVVEFVTDLTSRPDVEFVTEAERFEMSDEAMANHDERIADCKVGGTPAFLQGDEFPFETGSQLLAQLDEDGLPFEINFGDMGTGYAFLSEDGRDARFLWQCG